MVAGGRIELVRGLGREDVGGEIRTRLRDSELLDLIFDLKRPFSDLHLPQVSIFSRGVSGCLIPGLGAVSGELWFHLLEIIIVSLLRPLAQPKIDWSLDSRWLQRVPLMSHCFLLSDRMISFISLF